MYPYVQVFQAQDLVSAIADNKSLRKLKLAHMKFDTITFNCLVELLRVNKSITEFDLRGIQHVDKQVFQLIEAMKLNTKLEFLDLQGVYSLFTVPSYYMYSYILYSVRSAQEYCKELLPFTITIAVYEYYVSSYDIICYNKSCSALQQISS